MTDLSGRIALVTGAAEGIGRATAELLAASGAKVMVTDIADEGAAVARAIGGHAAFASLDVRDEAQWISAVDQAERIFGPINVLVNNAGAFVDQSIADFDTAAFDRVTRVNQLGAMLGMKSAVPAMRKAAAVTNSEFRPPSPAPRPAFTTSSPPRSSTPGAATGRS